MTTDTAKVNGVEHIVKPLVDDEAYAPTYAEAFPPLQAQPDGEPIESDDVLGGAPSAAQSVTAASMWGSHKMAVRSSVVTQVSSAYNRISIFQIIFFDI